MSSLDVGVGDWSLIQRSNARLAILEYPLYLLVRGEYCMRRFERWDGDGMGVAYGVTAWLREGDECGVRCGVGCGVGDWLF
jgi:hypothetical protein